MHKAAGLGLLLAFVAMAAAMMVSGGEHLGLVVMVIGGMVLFVARANAIVDRGRLRRGKSVDFAWHLDDFAMLSKRDWQELGITVLVSFALVVTGVVAFGRGLG